MDERAELHVLVGGLGELEHVCRLEAGGVGAARGIGHEPVETGGGHLHLRDVGPHDLERLRSVDAVALAPRDGGLLGHGEGGLRGARLGERLLHGKAGSARELGHQLACPLVADELVLGTGERHEEQATHVVFVLLVREEHVSRQVGGGAPADAPAPVVGVGDVDARELVELTRVKHSLQVLVDVAHRAVEQSRHGLLREPHGLVLHENLDAPSIAVEREHEEVRRAVADDSLAGASNVGRRILFFWPHCRPYSSPSSSSPSGSSSTEAPTLRISSASAPSSRLVTFLSTFSTARVLVVTRVSRVLLAVLICF